MHRRGSKPVKPSGPPPDLTPGLFELLDILRTHLKDLTEHQLQLAFTKTYGSVEKGFGHIRSVQCSIRAAVNNKKCRCELKETVLHALDCPEYWPDGLRRS